LRRARRETENAKNTDSLKGPWTGKEDFSGGAGGKNRIRLTLWGIGKEMTVRGEPSS